VKREHGRSEEHRKTEKRRRKGRKSENKNAMKNTGGRRAD